jgi:hypothetical protein
MDIPVKALNPLAKSFHPDEPKNQVRPYIKFSNPSDTQEKVDRIVTGPGKELANIETGTMSNSISGDATIVTKEKDKHESTSKKLNHEDGYSDQKTQASRADLPPYNTERSGRNSAELKMPLNDSTFEKDTKLKNEKLSSPEIRRTVDNNDPVSGETVAPVNEATASNAKAATQKISALAPSNVKAAQHNQDGASSSADTLSDKSRSLQKNPPHKSGHSSRMTVPNKSDLTDKPDLVQENVKTPRIEVKDHFDAMDQSEFPKLNSPQRLGTDPPKNQKTVITSEENYKIALLKKENVPVSNMKNTGAAKQKKTNILGPQNHQPNDQTIKPNVVLANAWANPKHLTQERHSPVINSVQQSYKNPKASPPLKVSDSFRAIGTTDPKDQPAIGSSSGAIRNRRDPEETIWRTHQKLVKA